MATGDQAGLPLFSASVWLDLFTMAVDAGRARLNADLQTALSDDTVAQMLSDGG